MTTSMEAALAAVSGVAGAGNAGGMQIGTVTSLRDPNTGTIVSSPNGGQILYPGVTIDGADSDVFAVSCDDYPFPGIGDRVMCAKIQSRLYVIKVITKAQSGINAYYDDKYHHFGMWQEPAWQNGVQPYSFGAGAYAYGIPRFRKDPAGCVILGGLMNVPNALSAGAVLFTLPEGYRPNYLLPFVVVSASTGTAHTPALIYIHPNGDVTYQSGGTASGAVGFLSFDGCSFMAEDQQKLDWTVLDMSIWASSDYLGPTDPALGHAPLRYYIDAAGDYHFSGSCRSTTSTDLWGFLQLPAAINAAKDYPQEVYITAAAGGWVRVDQGATDSWVVTPVTGNTGNTSATEGWVSMEGIVVPNPAQPWTSSSTLLNSWTTFSSNFAPPGYKMTRFGRSYARGLVKGGTGGSYGVATLFGANYALLPTFRQVHMNLAGGYVGRSELFPAGAPNANGDFAAGYQYGAGSNSYVSLSGYKWYASIYDPGW